MAMAPDPRRVVALALFAAAVLLGAVGLALLAGLFPMRPFTARLVGTILLGAAAADAATAMFFATRS